MGAGLAIVSAHGPLALAIDAAHAMQAAVDFQDVGVGEAGALQEAVDVLGDQKDALGPLFLPTSQALMGGVGGGLQGLLAPRGQVGQGLWARGGPMVHVHGLLGLGVERPSALVAAVDRKARRRRETGAAKDDDAPGRLGRREEVEGQSQKIAQHGDGLKSGAAPKPGCFGLSRKREPRSTGGFRRAGPSRRMRCVRIPPGRALFSCGASIMAHLAKTDNRFAGGEGARRV